MGTDLRNTDRPSALILSRQDLPILDRKVFACANQAVRGGYVLADSDNKRCCLGCYRFRGFFSLETKEVLAKDGIAARVVSMPWC